MRRFNSCCKAFLLILICLCGAGKAGAESATSLEKIKAANSMTLGYRDASYPLSYVDSDGSPIGYHMDICRKIVTAVATKLGVPDLHVNFQKVTSSNRLDLVESGVVDLECGSTTNNQDRQKHVAFAPTTFMSRTRVAVRADSGLSDLSQLNGRVVVTTKGSDSFSLLKAKHPDLKVKVMYGDDHAQSFALLESGTADAFVMDDNLLAGLIAGSAHPSAFRVLTEVLDYQPIAIMYRRNDPVFKEVVDKAVSALLKSGSAEQLYNRWFLQPIPPNGAVLNFPMTPMMHLLFQYPGTDTVESLRPVE